MRALRYSFLLFIVLSASAAFSQCTDHDYVTSFDLPTPWVGGTRPTGHVTVHKSVCQPDHDVLLTFGSYVYARCSYNTSTSCAVPKGSSTVDLTITAGPTYADFNTTWFVQASYMNDPGIYQPVTILAPNTCVQTDRSVVAGNSRDVITGTVSVSPVLVDGFSVNLSTDHFGLIVPSSVAIPANAGSQTFQILGASGPNTVNLTTSPKPTCTAPISVLPDPFRADMPCPD